MDERLTPPPARASAALKHLGAFALAHFSLSLASCASGFVVMEYPALFISLALGLIALFYPLGRLFGGSMGDRRELAVAVASQTAIAWCWAGLVLWAFYSDGEPLWALIPLTFCLAYPSCLLVLVGMVTFGTVGFLPGPMVGMALMAVPAGLLPPLLFNLGSLHATRREAQREERTADP